MYPPLAPATDDDLIVRLKGIRRMRLLATGLLLAVTAVFVATFFIHRAFPEFPPLWSEMIRAFAEAAMVGAIADWFAVVALFRHPFGIPIPHTAVIPRKHARIATGIGRFVAQNLLASTAMAQRLEELDPAGRAAGWLAQSKTSALIARRMADTLPPILETIGQDRLRGAVGGALRKGLDIIITPSRMAGMLAFAANQNYHQSLLDLALDSVHDFVGRHETFIRAKVSERCGEWMPLWVENRLADGVIEGIADALSELRKQDHPQRREIDISVHSFIEQMAVSPEFEQRLETLKGQILDDPAIESYLQQSWGGLYATLADDSSTLEGIILQTVQGLAQRLQDDANLRRSVNHWLREAVEKLLIPRREAIGTIIADLIMRWRTEALVDRLESHVGQDLQYIRINGTIVGGLAGVAIHLISKHF